MEDLAVSREEPFHSGYEYPEVPAWMRHLLIARQGIRGFDLHVYDEGAHIIYLHTARIGRTRSNFEQGGLVSFSVSEMGRILPSEIALEYSVEYAGVTVFGQGSVVEDEDEKFRALQLLMDKYAPHLQPDRDYRPANQEELDLTSVLRIDIESWSGKSKEEASDFPSAFWYDQRRRPSPFHPGNPS